MGMSRLSVIAMLVAASLTLVGCADDTVQLDSAMPDAAGEPASVQEQSLSERLTTLDRAIREEVGIARADSFDQCQLLAVGKRACGGPEFYMVYSTVSSDAAKLQALANEYTELRVQQIAQTGEMSTCEILPKPGVMLEGGICKVVQSVDR